MQFNPQGLTPPAGERFEDVFLAPEDDPADFSDVSSGSSSAAVRKAPRGPALDPMGNLIRRLVVEHPEETEDVYRGIARSPLSAADQASRTIRGFLHPIGTKAELEAAGRKTADDNSWAGDINDAVFGRTRTNAGQMTEQILAMGLTYLATDGLAAGAGVGTGLLPALGKGAVVAAVAQNPYSANLSELLTAVGNDNGMPGLAAVAETFNVDESDSEFEARLKRSVFDLAPSALFEIAVPLFRASKAFSKGNAQGAKAELEKIALYAQAPQPKLGPVQVKAEADGRYVLVGPEAPPATSLADELADPLPPHRPSFAKRAEAEVNADAINAAAADLHIADAHPSTLAPDEHAAFVQMAQRLQATTDPLEVESILNGSRLNLARHRAPQGTLAVLEAGNRILLEAVEKNPVALEITKVLGRQTYQAAADAGLLPEFLKHAPDLSQLHIYGTAVRIGMHEQGRSAAAALTRWEATRTAADYEMLAKSVDNLKNFMLRDDQIATAEGRALGSRVIDIGTEGTPRPVAEGVVQAGDKVTPIDLRMNKDAPPTILGQTPRDVLAIAQAARLADGSIVNTFKVARLAKEIERNPNWISRASSWFVSSLLAFPTTMMSPVVSGLPTTGLIAARNIVAGGIHAARSGETELLREGLDFANYVFSRKGLGEAIKAAKLSFAAGRSIIDPKPIIHNMEPGILRTISEFAPRTMGAGDELTKVLNYRAEVVAKSLRANRGRLSGQALVDAVDKDLAAAFDLSTGIATLPETLERSTVAGFSGALKPGTLSSHIHNLVNSLDSKGSRFIAPFVRASALTTKFAVDHTPALGLLFSENQEAIKLGGEAAAHVYAKQAVGGAIMASGYLAYKEGLITGRAPADPKLAAVWRENNQEYSIRTPAGWVSYRRIQPFASILSMAADVSMVMQSDDAPTDDVAAAVTAYGTMLASILASPTYGAPIFDLFGSIFDRDWNGVYKFEKNLVSSFAVPRAIAAMNPDQAIHETQTILDAVIAKTPWSETVPTRTNFLGEPLLRGFGNNFGGYAQVAQSLFNPMPIKPIAADVVTAELERLGVGVTPPSSRENDLINLKDERHAQDGLTPYAAWMGYVCSGWEGQPSLRAELTRFINSKDYKSLEESGAEFGMPGGQKSAELYAKVSVFYKLAKERMYQDFPELAEKVNAYKDVKRLLNSGDSGGALDNFLKATR